MFNKSEIMKKANNLRKIYGLSKSEALAKAWAMAKLDKLEEDIFMLEMKDRSSQEDFRISEEMNKAARELKSKIYPSVIKTVEVDPLGKATRNRLLRELEEIGSRLGTDSDIYLGYRDRNITPFPVKLVEVTALDEDAYAAA